MSAINKRERRKNNFLIQHKGRRSKKGLQNFWKLSLNLHLVSRFYSRRSLVSSVPLGLLQLKTFVKPDKT